MYFINALIEKNPSADRDKEFPVNNSLDLIDGYSLSIQGSKGHYCSPKMDGSIDIYTSMEIAFMKGGELVAPSEVPTLLSFPKYRELEDYICDMNENEPLAFVPVELINEIYNHFFTTL